MLQARPASVTTDVVTTADSSALVKMGSTTVLAGIKLEVAVPSDSAPDQGRLVMAAEVAPLAGTGPGHEAARQVLHKLGFGAVLSTDAMMTAGQSFCGMFPRCSAARAASTPHPLAPPHPSTVCHLR